MTTAPAATPGRFGGRLVTSYSVTVPADPGWAQPDRHDADADGSAVERDNAPGGGGWQPDAWTSTAGLAGLRGVDLARGATGHHGGGGHAGDEGRGRGVRRTPLDNTDALRGGDTEARRFGAGGAAHGGLVAQGSADWMSPGVTRRRADGGTVVRQPGYRLGLWHLLTRDKHRQGLHMNRPTIRGIREKQIVRSTAPSLRPVGAVPVRQRQAVAPYSTPVPQETYAQLQPASPGVLGSQWVM